MRPSCGIVPEQVPDNVVEFARIPFELIPVFDDGARDSLVGDIGDDFRIGRFGIDFFDRITGNDQVVYI